MDGSESRGGRLVVDRQLRLRSAPGVYVIGDCAYIEDGKGGAVPSTAAAAVQEGRFVARHMSYAILGGRRGGEMVFGYRGRGVMLSLDRFQGVARLRSGIMLSGFAGWVAWRFVHIALISTLRSRLGVLFDWTLAIFYKRIVTRTDYD